MQISALTGMLWLLSAALGLIVLGLLTTADDARRQRLILIGGGLAQAAILALIALLSGLISVHQLLLIALGGALWRRYRALRRRQAGGGHGTAAQLRRLTPGLIAFVRIALSSHEAPAAVLTRYCAQASALRQPMQQLVSSALLLSEQQRLRPFAALAETARRTDCRELMDAAEALAQAEAQGHSVEQVLAAQQQTLEYLLQSEFRRLIRRRTVYLLLLTALSLVGGILINVLYVMTEGGRVFSQPMF